MVTFNFSHGAFSRQFAPPHPSPLLAYRHMTINQGENMWFIVVERKSVPFPNIVQTGLKHILTVPR